MSLNPDWNLYSVAPVGPLIVIGHRRAMQSGLTRESAMNLIACLIISAEAAPGEIAAEMVRVQQPSQPVNPTRRVLGNPNAQAPTRAVTQSRQTTPTPAIPAGIARPTAIPVAPIDLSTVVPAQPGRNAVVAAMAVAPPPVSVAPPPPPAAPPAFPPAVSPPEMGTLDAEESAAVADAVVTLPPEIRSQVIPAQSNPAHPVHGTHPVDVDALTQSWMSQANGAPKA